VLGLGLLRWSLASFLNSGFPPFSSAASHLGRDPDILQGLTLHGAAAIEEDNTGTAEDRRDARSERIKATRHWRSGPSFTRALFWRSCLSLIDRALCIAEVLSWFRKRTRLRGYRESLVEVSRGVLVVLHLGIVFVAERDVGSGLMPFLCREHEGSSPWSAAVRSIKPPCHSRRTSPPPGRRGSA